MSAMRPIPLCLSLIHIYMNCLANVGLLSTSPVEYNGQEIVPIQFLKALLPDPASLGIVCCCFMTSDYHTLRSLIMTQAGKRADAFIRTKGHHRASGGGGYGPAHYAAAVP